MFATANSRLLMFHIRQVERCCPRLSVVHAGFPELTHLSFRHRKEGHPQFRGLTRRIEIVGEEHNVRPFETSDVERRRTILIHPVLLPAFQECVVLVVTLSFAPSAVCPVLVDNAITQDELYIAVPCYG